MRYVKKMFDGGSRKRVVFIVIPDGAQVPPLGVHIRGIDDGPDVVVYPEGIVHVLKPSFLAVRFADSDKIGKPALDCHISNDLGIYCFG